MVSISQLDMNLSVVTLKVFCLIHRQMLYAPKINALSYEKLFNREFGRWTQIGTLAQGHVGDYYRTPLLIKLITQYIEILMDKLKLVKEHGNIINSAYVLQPNTVGTSN